MLRSSTAMGRNQGMDQGMTVGDLGSHQHPCRAAQLAGLKEEERGEARQGRFEFEHNTH